MAISIVGKGGKKFRGRTIKEASAGKAAIEKKKKKPNLSVRQPTRDAGGKSAADRQVENNKAKTPIPETVELNIE